MKTLDDAIYDALPTVDCRNCGSDVAFSKSDIDAARTAALDWMEERIPKRIKKEPLLSKDFIHGWNACRDWTIQRIKEERG